MADPRALMIDDHPRVTLGHWPTPIEHCARLAAELGGGPRIWVKRDDCTGLALGGNKTRKLEFLLGQAIAEGHDTVVTFGAVQSNHARQTAAACARLGLRCELILSRSVPRSDETYATSGNVLLDRLLGARVRVADGLDETMAALEEIGPAFHIPPGGSNAVGTLGYVAAAFELGGQLSHAQAGSGALPAVPPHRIVLAASTAGTAAGLVVGCALAGRATDIDIVAVYAPAEATRSRLEVLIEESTALLGAGRLMPSAEVRGAEVRRAEVWDTDVRDTDVRDTDVPHPEMRVPETWAPGRAGSPAEPGGRAGDGPGDRSERRLGPVRWRVHDRWLGRGYGVPTAEMTEAVRLFARTEGLLLDPVYSGKAAAGLIGMIRSGEIGADESVLFWHTGGTPALFVHPDAL